MPQDLSDVFGRPATASLRDLLPRRTGETRPPEDRATVPEARPVAPRSAALVPTAAEADDPTAIPAEVDIPAPRAPSRSDRTATPTATRPTPARTTAARTTTARRPRNAATTNRTTTNRRWGVARVASRDHVDLLVLLALRHGPADGQGVITRLGERSGGALDAPERTVHATLHRLARNRLLARKPDPASGRHLYVMTAAGERAARSRLREWQALARCMDAVAGTDAHS